MDNSVLFQISYGMYFICSCNDEKPVGCVANTLVQITSEDPIFAISLNKNNHTYNSIVKSGRFSISIISEKTPASVISTFGFFSSKDTDKFKDISYQIKDNIPYINECCSGYLTFEVISVSDIETHAVVFARLKDSFAGEKNIPMTYSYYHNTVKGKAPKSAPTYQAESNNPPRPEASYVCDVCGYVYSGSEIPDDYVCPICGVSKEHFKKSAE